MIEQLRKLMTFDAQMGIVDVDQRFGMIAKLLFEHFAIQKGGNIYLFQEIEFYFYNAQHRDIITHPRESEALCWYVNDFGGMDLNFECKIEKVFISKKYGKVQKKYLLNDTTFFGGILIRRLISGDRCELLSGPWACAELFRCFDALNGSMPRLIERDNGMVGYIQKPRVNILSSNKTVERKVDYLLDAYYAHPDSKELYEDFRKYKDARYRYIRSEILLHDRETNEV